MITLFTPSDGKTICRWISKCMNVPKMRARVLRVEGDYLIMELCRFEINVFFLICFLQFGSCHNHVIYNLLSDSPYDYIYIPNLNLLVLLQTAAATLKKIIELMGVDGLTKDEVSNHLQVS